MSLGLRSASSVPHPASTLVSGPQSNARPHGAGLMKIVYVGNLAPNCTVAHLRSLFEPYGRIGRIRLRKAEESRFGAHAFVEMSNEVEAEKAISGLSSFTGWVLRT